MTRPRSRAALVALPLAVLLATSFVPGVASAQEASRALPFRYAERPITLPALVLSPGLDLDITRFPSITPFGLGGGGQVELLTETPVSFGIVDDVMVDLVPLSVRWTPQTDWGKFAAGVTARFVRGPFELAGRFEFAINGESNLQWNPGLVARVHVGDVLRIDLGALVTFTWNFDAGVGGVGIVTPWASPPTVKPGVPIDVAFNVVDPLFLGVHTGFGILDFDNAEDQIFAPLGFFAGVTAPMDGAPLLDARLGFDFPRFVSRDGSRYGAVTQFWQLFADLRVFLPL